MLHIRLQLLIAWRRRSWPKHVALWTVFINEAAVLDRTLLPLLEFIRSTNTKEWHAQVWPVPVTVGKLQGVRQRKPEVREKTAPPVQVGMVTQIRTTESSRQCKFWHQHLASMPCLIVHSSERNGVGGTTATGSTVKQPRIMTANQSTVPS
jgi:hypothetical protein